MPIIYGERPRPRAIITGFPEDVANRLVSLFPTAEIVDDANVVHDTDFDVLVVRRGSAVVAPHLFVIAFSCQRFGHVTFSDPYLRTRGGTYTKGDLGKSGKRVAAREFAVPDEAPAGVRRLVDTVLHPVIDRRRDHAYFVLEVAGSALIRWGDVHEIRPFLMTRDRLVLACEFDRAGGQAQCWAFADDVDDPVPVVQAALARWADVAPDRFPRIEGWEQSSAWMTPEELSALRSLDAAKNQRERELQLLDAEVAQREAELEVKRAEADGGPRRLLTAQGGDLVHSVVDALSDLGFEVQDMDEVWSEGDNLEDLRVRLPDRDWTAVVEVRGYGKGAQQKDLLRITGRFVPRYMKDVGKAPEAAWYVVNQFLSDDPANRPKALGANEPEIVMFAEGESPGLVIDTVELFKLWQAVVDKRVSQEEARSLLTTSTGRFEAPSSEESASGGNDAR